jgi:hypothetical protein
MININKNPSAGIQERRNKCRKVVPDGEKECVWAEAGVVPYKLCNSHLCHINYAIPILIARTALSILSCAGATS